MKSACWSDGGQTNGALVGLVQANATGLGAVARAVDVVRVRRYSINHTAIGQKTTCWSMLAHMNDGSGWEIHCLEGLGTNVKSVIKKRCDQVKRSERLTS